MRIASVAHTVVATGTSHLRIAECRYGHSHSAIPIPRPIIHQVNS